MNWTDVKVGDTVTVKTKDVTLTGPLVRWWRLRNDAVQFDVGGFTVFSNESELVEHKVAYRDGDIAVYTSLSTGTWVGIYDAKDGMFYDNTDADSRAALFDVSGEDITIIGNVKDFVK